MDTKLTLVMSADVISSAKRYAKAHETSVSRLVEDFLKHLPMDDGPPLSPPRQPGPITASLTGAIPIRSEDQGKAAKELIREAKLERFL